MSLVALSFVNIILGMHFHRHSIRLLSCLQWESGQVAWRETLLLFSIIFLKLFFYFLNLPRLYDWPEALTRISKWRAGDGPSLPLKCSCFPCPQNWKPMFCQMIYIGLQRAMKINGSCFCGVVTGKCLCTRLVQVGIVTSEIHSNPFGNGMVPEYSLIWGAGIDKPTQSCLLKYWHCDNILSWNILTLCGEGWHTMLYQMGSSWIITE